MIGWEHLEYHPLAELFPMLPEEEASDLADRIEQLGFFSEEPITLYQGRILDGRNRYRACLTLHMEGRLPKPPPFEQFRENGATPLEWVVSKNLHRRHLTASQRAMLAAEAIGLYAEEARQRQVASLRRGAETPVPATLPERERGEAREKAAEQFGVSARYVQAAKAIAEQAPDLVEPVKSGEMTLQQARSQVKKRERPPVRPATIAPPEGTFDLLYADPPWRYEFCSVDDWAVENSYPTLALDEICALGERIAELAAPDSVLFLWATSPKLPDALRVMEAWGFGYKTSLVWIKHRTGAGMGYYVRVDHELLLIGVRGKAGPPPADRRSSSVIEAPKGRHSAKPQEARAIIEAMYPDARRLELFAREEPPGWTVWGSEVPS